MLSSHELGAKRGSTSMCEVEQTLFLCETHDGEHAVLRTKHLEPPCVSCEQLCCAIKARNAWWARSFRSSLHGGGFKIVIWTLPPWVTNLARVLLSWMKSTSIITPGKCFNDTTRSHTSKNIWSMQQTDHARLKQNSRKGTASSRKTASVVYGYHNTEHLSPSVHTISTTSL